MKATSCRNAILLLSIIAWIIRNGKKIGTDFKMRFDYTRLFMGSKFAIFNYATKSLGGYIDVDYFDFSTS